MRVKNKDLYIELVLRFTALIVHRYEIQCKRTNEEPTFDGLVTYLIRRNVIRDRTIARYMVQDLYPRAMYDTDGKKVQAVGIVAEQTGLGERTVWNIVQHPPDFSDKEPDN